MTQPTLKIYYMIKATVVETDTHFYPSSIPVERSYDTLEKAKEIQTTLIDSLQVRADTQSLVYEIFRYKNCRLASVDNSLYKVQIITSVVEDKLR